MGKLKGFILVYIILFVLIAPSHSKSTKNHKKLFLNPGLTLLQSHEDQSTLDSSNAITSESKTPSPSSSTQSHKTPSKSSSSSKESASQSSEPTDTSKSKESSSSKTSKSSSLGSLGGGLESVSIDVNQLASQLSDSLKNLDDSIDSNIKVTVTSSVALLNSSIQDKQHELKRVKSRIHELESDLSETSGLCNEFISCSGCVKNSNCVWCNSERACVPGDEAGPYKGQCSSWDHDKCIVSSCEVYNTCNTCLSHSDCGWCENGRYCLNAKQESEGDCDPTFFYHSKAYGKDQCPEGTGKSYIKDKQLESSPVESSVNSSYSTASETDTAKQIKELKNLKEYASQLEAEIDELEIDKQDIIDEGEAGSRIEVNNIDLGHPLYGLEDNVDTLYQNEIQDDRDYTDQVADTTSNKIIEGTYSIVNQSKGTIVKNQEDNTYRIIDNLQEYSTITQQEIQNDKIEMNEKYQTEKYQYKEDQTEAKTRRLEEQGNQNERQEGKTETTPEGVEVETATKSSETTKGSEATVILEARSFLHI